MALFDSDFLKKLEYLSLVSKRVFRGQILAQRRTMQLGGGIEFADHRDYAPGDDLRYLDWNVFARHNELLIKRFQEEEDLHVYIMVDCSRSMALGAPPKFDLARQVAAALGYIALADLDRVSILGVAGEILGAFPLARGKARILSMLKFLENLEPKAVETDLAKSAKNFVLRAQRRGLAVVISDLYDPNGFERGLDILRHHRHEPHLIQIIDKAEADPKFLGDLELFDIETDSLQKVTITERSLKQYKVIFENFQESVRHYCNTYAISRTQTACDVPFDQLVLGMMRVAGSVAS